MNDQPPVPVLQKQKPAAKTGVNRKWLILLFLFFISIFILVFFHSPLGKVSVLEISDTRFVSEEKIRQAAGTEVGDRFFAVQAEQIRQNILSLGWIEEVVVTKQFPGKIFIDVQEYAHVGFELKNGQLHAILANGTTAVPTVDHPLPDKPILSGWEQHEQLKQELCRMLADIPAQWLADISEIRPDPSHSYRDRIIFYSRSSFEVTTTIGMLQEKMAYFHEIIDELSAREQVGGRLILLEADTFIPFEDQADEPDGDRVE